MRVTLRAARADEWVALRRFVARSHLDASGYCPAALEVQISELPADFPSLYDAARFAAGASWVAEARGGALVGCVGFTPGDDDDSGGAPAGPAASLDFFFVHPRLRGCGLGRALLHTAARAAAAAGYARLQLLTLGCRYAGAVALYRSEGFVEYKALPHYTGPGGWTFHLVWLRLELPAWAATRGAHAGGAPPPALPAEFDVAVAGTPPEDDGALRAWLDDPTAFPLPWDWPGRGARVEEALAMTWEGGVTARYDAEVAAAVAAAGASGATPDPGPQAAPQRGACLDSRDAHR
jgi:GNAT superfamily N-acetyltransferase